MSEDPIFRPVRTRRGFEVLCDRIREQLALGQLRPGDRLPGERELAERYGIGRSAARDALRSLEAVGVVEARKGANGGFFIRSVGSEGLAQTVQDMMSLAQVSIESVTEARVEITCVAVRLACERATEAELDAIQSDIDWHTGLFERGAGSRNTRSVIEFYRLIAQATHNPLIVLMVDALSEAVRDLLARVDPRPNKALMTMRQHVLDQIRRRDPVAAAQAMAAHLRRVSEYLASESGGQGVRQAAGR
jgi:GntR family transcriptional repressor for pyruvate dehydrogenase complex